MMTKQRSNAIRPDAGTVPFSILGYIVISIISIVALISEDLFTLASYYKKDMRDSEFFPTSDWEQLPGGECDEGWIEEDEASHDA